MFVQIALLLSVTVFGCCCTSSGSVFCRRILYLTLSTSTTDQKNVQMLEVGEVEDMFIPNHDDLLVNLDQSRNLVEDFLTTLPDAHATACHTQSALGAALNAAFKLMVGTVLSLGDAVPHYFYPLYGS